jgi:Flp pilus assembly protein TadB
MHATPARRPPYAPQSSARPQPTRSALHRRRRAQHFARRRRDLLEDIAAALLVTLLAITLTAGLGVVVLIELPVALALVSSYLVDRRRHRRRSRWRRHKPITRPAVTNGGSGPGRGSRTRRPHPPS